VRVCVCVRGRKRVGGGRKEWEGYVMTDYQGAIQWQSKNLSLFQPFLT